MISKMIYVHIPFCERKCYYCSFCSFDAEQEEEKYFETLSQEIASRAERCLITSIYFGGGTPSVVDPKYIAKTFTSLAENFIIGFNCEITIEINPSSSSYKKLKQYNDMGFNRVSIGVQSLDSKKLEKIGRYQNSESVIKAIRDARMAGIDNVSVDLLLGLEGQTLESIKEDIETLYDERVSHISLYMLMIEENTILSEMVKNKDYIPIDDETCVEYYDEIVEYLKELGYQRYEVSNFARLYRECKHNMGYWQMKEYKGFGLSAHSFENGKRLANANNFNDYYNGVVEEEICSEKTLTEERIMLALRTANGIHESFIPNKEELEKLIDGGYLMRDGARIFVAEKHFGILNQLILKLI